MNKFKKIRKLKHLTQTEAAKELGVTLRTIQYWESDDEGTPSAPSMAIRLLALVKNTGY